MLAIAEPIAWHLAGARGCIGVWSKGRRHPCPAAVRIPETGADAQCRACAARGTGRALARDTAVDDDRPFVLYLAWFGDGLVKVGLTAAEREHDRLLEQAAIAFTLLATGPYLGIRRAEQTIAATGLARERIGARAKAAAWWALLPEPERARRVTEAAAAIQAAAIDAGPAWPSEAELLAVHVVDQAAAFALPDPFPASYAELTGVRDGAVLAGQVAAIIGRRLLLDTATGPLLADMRLLAGRPFTPILPTGALPTPTGLDTTQRDHPGAHHDEQESLF